MEPIKYKGLKQKMAKINVSLREIKSLIVEDLMENQEENDAEFKEEDEVESSEGEEEKHEFADEKSDSKNSEEESDPSESENEGDLNDIFKEKEEVI